MRTKITETKVYKFEELNQEAKDRAVNDMIQFMLDTYDPEQCTKDFKRAVDKSEAMQTPWFAGSYVYEYCLPEIIETIKINEYEFDENGNIA